MDQWLKTGTVKRSVPRTEKETQNEEFASESSKSSPNKLLDQAEENLKCSKKRKDEDNIPSAKKRKYFDEYLSYGFTSFVENDYPRPKCVVCGELLANSSMKPSLLRRHLETKHENYAKKDRIFFERLLKQKDVVSYFGTVRKEKENAVEASYKISYHIAKAGKNHTIAENLILPCIKDAVSCMLGDESAKTICTIPLSNSTISRRIQDMSDDIEETVVSRIKNSNYFAIQVDESTDVTKCAVLLVIGRYVYKNEMEENLLLCYPLPETTKGADIFDAINGYFVENDISWDKCCGLSTDGAKSMSGCFIGLRACVKEVAPHVTWTHCCIHRQSLACKGLPPDFKSVLDEAVKIVNVIKSKALNSRLFKSLCEDMDSIHLNLLYHTEVRWLSRGKVLERLFELRYEVQLFFEETPFYLSSKMHDSGWLQCLAYLADIFQQLNKLNLALQLNSLTIFKVTEKIESMTKKIEFWHKCILEGKVEMFETLHRFLKENKLHICDSVKLNITEHLKELKMSFTKYFPKLDAGVFWIQDPFSEENFQSAKLTISEKETLIELSTDNTLKSEFKSKTIVKFWIDLSSEYQHLSRLAIKFLLPYPSTVLVERAFSSYAFIKNKYRNKLNTAPDLRLYLSSFEPNFRKLSEDKQGQGSH